MNAIHAAGERASLEKRTRRVDDTQPVVDSRIRHGGGRHPFLTNRASARPVIDESAGNRCASRADILVFDRENAGVFYDSTESPAEELPLPERGEEVRVAEVMTPVVFSVRPQTPAIEVAEEMVRLHVHRMFVVDDSGVLVGVVSSLDMLRELVD